ncbi:sigma 54-interacting transcriptional regulator [Sinomicrobium weinanense]|uniref:Sigma-54-dependent Fis family transcriptional regulator n=1 Tax=Sinomicrobium weinanense TaxID=2842200 RepID=A0A926Q339_9FLAO|nr:sigma-54-dependent Fis family transcriptional regulator [Sinomicrobium weinanense]MBU3122356.1 sigma-54 dependent transcriptional regulator [Sinomicrobium weinanense]
MTPSILIIDDEKDLLNMLARILELEGYRVYKAETAKAGKDVLKQQAINVLLADVKLPDGHGISLIEEYKGISPETEVICLTAYGNIPDGVQAIKNGALDYLVKGDDNVKIVPLVSKAVEKSQLRFKIKRLHARIQEDFGFDKIIGTSKAIKEAIQLAQKVAPLDTTVLLNGETGTGKEVFAKAIHAHSERKTEQFLAINCSALGRDILESELFGHKAGAFTGAQRDKKGLLEEAHLGTLFLDEIGEMDIDLQAKILRFLEEGTFIKLGDTKESKVDVRIIAATHRDLKAEVDRGNFREDLYYRLSAFTVVLPSLNERVEDIPLLAEYFIRSFNVKNRKQVDRMSPEFRNALLQHHWKGNIRELRNIVERAVILAETDILEAELLPMDFYFSKYRAKNTPVLSLKEMEQNHIQNVLEYVNGNKTRAAKLLGIGLTTLYRKMEEYGLDS